MNVRRHLRTALESVLVCAAFATIPWWPRRLVVRTANGIGRVTFLICRRLRRIALANLRTAYADTMDESEHRRIAVRSMQTFALTVLDIFWFSAFTRRRIRHYVVFDESMNPCLPLHPTIYVTGHIGNWEVVGLAMALHGAPLLSIAARLKSPAGEFVINRVRRRTGQEIIHKRGALRGIMRELRLGGRVAMLLDQNTPPHKGGVFVEFFGLPVPVSDAASVLCSRTGAHMIVAVCVPDGLGYRVWAMPPDVVGGEQGVPPDGITQRLTSHFETMVRRFPGCWAWAYKRWKYIPAGTDSARYPFYARTYRNNNPNDMDPNSKDEST